MKKHLFLVFIIIAMPVYANDGGIAVVGNALHPVNIANVSMDYERLNITCRERYYEIEAYIELYNHDGAAIRPLVGFEFYIGMYGEGARHLNTNSYILLVNNEPQKFEYGVQENGREIHTLVYRPELKPGKNAVYHKLQLPYGFGSAEGVVSYLLETSSRWKGGIIKNLEIFIRTEFSTIFLFNERQDSTSVISFDTIGESKLFNHGMNGMSEASSRQYYSLTPNGYLYKRIENFVPDRNISFQLLDFLGPEMYIWYIDPPYIWPCDNSFITILDWKRYIENPEFRRYSWGDNFLPSEKMLEKLSTEQLRILRNTLYAIYGYVFNDSFLRDYFNKQYWYFPNPNITQNAIDLSAAEQKILEYIVAEENRR